MFSTSFSGANDALPTPAWTMPAFSTRNSTAPPLAAFTAAVTSMVTVPTFGLGIRPRGPSTLPRRPTSGIMSGVAMQRSKSIAPPCTFSTRSSAPTTSAPAARASSALAPRANTPTRTLRPDPFGSLQTPRPIWSAWRGSTPRFIATSMVSSNLALARSFTILTASASGYILVRSMPSRAARVRFPGFAMALPHHLEAHRARRALDHAHGRLDGRTVEILHLLLGDLLDLRLGDGADRATARRLGAALDIGRFLEEMRHRRRLHLERERAVRIDRDDHRERCALLHVLRLRVERLAELHDVETALAERRPDRRRRIGRAGGHLQFQVAGELLCHVKLLLGPALPASQDAWCGSDGWRPPLPPTR